MRLILYALLVCWTSLSVAQMPDRTSLSVNYTDRNTGATISGTDVGRFQNGEPNVVIVPDGTDDTIVCRYRSIFGNCYRLSINDGKGHVPVVLVDRSSFDNWGEALESRANWGRCEIIDDPWGPWEVVGSIPTDPGTHTYTEQRACSTANALNACPDTCLEQTQTRTAVVENPVACADTSWAPDPWGYYESSQFIQTSNCGNTRYSWGAYPDEPQCSDVSWTPATDWYNLGTPFYQTSNCGNSRPATGSFVYVPPACDANSWSGQDPSSYFNDETRTHTNACGTTKQVYGSMVRPVAPPVTPPPPPPPPCVPVPGSYSGMLSFRYANGAEDFPVFLSAGSYEELISSANSVIDSYTSGGYFVYLGYQDFSVQGVSCP